MDDTMKALLKEALTECSTCDHPCDEYTQLKDTVQELAGTQITPDLLKVKPWVTPRLPEITQAMKPYTPIIETTVEAALSEFKKVTTPEELRDLLGDIFCSGVSLGVYIQKHDNPF